MAKTPQAKRALEAFKQRFDNSSRTAIYLQQRGFGYYRCWIVVIDNGKTLSEMKFNNLREILRYEDDTDGRI